MRVRRVSFLTARYSDVLGAIAAGCDRLVHPSATGEGERQRHGRLIGVLLASPFLAAAAGSLLLPPHLGVAVTLAFICAACGTAWLAALLAAATGRDNAAKIVALVAGIAAIAALTAAAGGLASPMALIVLALPFEAYWTGRTAKAAVWGGAAAVAALALQAALSFGSTSPALWHWLVPMAYAATLLARLAPAAGKTVTAREEIVAPRLEDIIDAVVLRIAPGGDIFDATEKSRQILKLPPELLLGTGLFDRIHIADRVGYLCALADLREGRESRKVEVRIRLPQKGGNLPGDNYRHFTIELRRDPDGQAFIALLRDNEEMAELRQALAEAVDANDGIDLAKGRFLAAVSHELRTPLNAIIGFSDMLLHEMFGPFGDPRQKEYVGLVRDSGQHLLEVVNSILDVSKIEAGSYAMYPEPFRFREAVEMCRSMMSLQAKDKKIGLHAEVAAETGEIYADKRAVQQMLINLVSNAVKFTPEGGRVVIGGKRIGSRLHFWVSDTGIGIAEQDLSTIGKPFSQVQNDYTRQYEGTGLGLSLVKGLVGLHDGTMSIESALGEGTTVTISLPVDGPAGESGGEPELLPMPGRTKEKADGTLRKAG
jgi:two-component system, cell cycle sensor histidine kinase DivJ